MMDGTRIMVQPVTTFFLVVQGKIHLEVKAVMTLSMGMPEMTSLMVKAD